MNSRILLNLFAFIFGCLVFFSFSKKTQDPKVSLKPAEIKKAVLLSAHHHKLEVTQPDKSEEANHQPKEKNPFFEIQEARKERSISSREEWDEKKQRYSDFTLYFLDTRPRDMAEELINAYR